MLYEQLDFLLKLKLVDSYYLALTFLYGCLNWHVLWKMQPHNDLKSKDHGGNHSHGDNQNQIAYTF